MSRIPFVSLARALPARVDDWVNPIVVKELRQAVRGRTAAAMLSFFLFVETATLGFALLRSQLLSEASGGALGEGTRAFSILLGVLLGTAFLFVPVATWFRMTSERNDQNLDLLFVTTLTPGEIASGKLLAGGFLTLWLFSASLPFLTFTYFLRGVDFFTVLVLLSIGYLGVLAATQVALLAATVPGTKVFRALVALLALWGVVTIATLTIASSIALLSSGAMVLFVSRDARIAAVVMLATFTSLFAVARVLTTACLTPQVANRARPVRLTFSVIWVLALGGSYALALLASDGEVFAVGLWGTYAILALTLLAAASERDRLGPRVLREVPAGARRLLAFPFFSGAASGLSWSVLVAALTTLFGTFARAYLPTRGTDDVERALVAGPGVLAYILCYALTGRFLRERFLGNRVSEGHTWVISLLLAVAASVLPVLVGVFGLSAHEQPRSLFPWLVLNPFSVLDAQHAPVYVTIGATLALLSVFPKIRWFLAKVREFRKPGDAA
ncbi:MAG: hypothetical protein JNK60_19920 [Acidobacteria bacterium]|nr:hypothetical protein [Acidobacteriota bacterium]